MFARVKLPKAIFALLVSYLCVCGPWKRSHIFVSAVENDNEDILPDEMAPEDEPKNDNFMFTSTKRSDTILESKFFVRVLLVGFDGDGQQKLSLPSNTLEENLQHSIFSHQPSSGDEYGEFSQLNAKFALQYEVTKASSNVLEEYEKILSTAMKKAKQDTVSIFEDVNTYDVEVQGPVEEYFDTLFEDEFIGKPGSRTFGDLELDSLHGVIVVNPDKFRSDVFFSGSNGKNYVPFRYRYTYGGVGYTQSWIGRKKYTVIDLSAGPCSYGPVRSNEGTVASSSFPRLSHFKYEFMGENDHESKGLPQYEVVSSLTSLIGSAIKHVFLPDISRETVYFAEKIIVPIVAFRDHQRFNPLLLNNGHTANKGSDVNTVVRNAIEKLLLPDQELVIVDSLHDLDDHKQIFAALYSSVRTDTVYDLQGDKYIPTIHRYIDEGMLRDSLRDAGDMLAEGLLRSADLYHIDPLVEAMESAEEQLQPEQLASVKIPVADKRNKLDPELMPKLSLQKMKEANKKNKNRRQSIRHKINGAKIIPVYLFSFGSRLKNGLDGLLFQDHSGVKSVGDCVIVLQSDVSNIVIPFFADGTHATVNVRDPTRHIIAGLAKTIGGLMEPYHYYSPLHEKMLYDYTWAFGCTPFGPYSNLNCISDIFVDGSTRNEVVSRLDSALRIARKAIKLVDVFAREYLFDYGHNNSWIDRTYHENEDTRALKLNSPMAFDIVARLHESVQQLVDNFGDAMDLMWSSKYRDLHFLSVSILRSATAFHEYTVGELDLIRHEMSCCRVKYNVLKEDITLWDYVYLSDWIREYTSLFILSLTLFCCIVYCFPALRSSKIQRRNPSRAGRGHIK